MKRILLLSLAALLFTSRAFAGPDTATLDLNQVLRTATNANSLFLDNRAKARVTSTFLKLVQIKGVSGKEQAIRDEVKRLLTLIGAKELATVRGSNAPLNLVMEIPATGGLTNLPAILLNAHLDTIAQCTPEHTVFDPQTGDFFHTAESQPGKVSSFGGDDRSGVSVVLEAVRTLQADYWKRGVAHRRIILVFTADEERGCVGAKYLARTQPELFANVDVTLSVDGPLDYKSDYPKDSFILVVAQADTKIQPHRRVLDLAQNFCDRTKLKFSHSEIGLGFGDFAFFPPSAHSGLHIRSPVRGWHNRERVKVQDLINHVDLMCWLVLGWDHSLPEKISPATLLPTK